MVQLDANESLKWSEYSQGKSLYTPLFLLLSLTFSFHFYLKIRLGCSLLRIYRSDSCGCRHFSIRSIKNFRVRSILEAHCQLDILQLASRCIIATLSSNLELNLWTANRNALKGEWTRDFGVTAYLINKFQTTMLESSRTAQALQAQVVSMLWRSSSQHIWLTGLQVYAGPPSLTLALYQSRDVMALSWLQETVVEVSCFSGTQFLPQAWEVIAELIQVHQ